MRWYRNNAALKTAQAAYDNAEPDDAPETDCEKGEHDWRRDSGNSEMTFYRCTVCSIVEER